VASDIVALKNFNGSLKPGQIAGLLLGIYFDAVCEPDLSVGITPGKNFKATKKRISARKRDFIKKRWKTENWLIKINRSKRVIGEAKGKKVEAINQSHLFPISDLSVSIADPTHKYLKKAITQKLTPPENRKAKTSEALIAELTKDSLASIHLNDGEQAKIYVKISYTVNGMPISYSAPLQIPVISERGYVPNLTQVPVVGEVVQDYSKSYSLGIILDKTKRVIACEVSGHARQNIPYLLQGQKYTFFISPRSSAWAHDLRSASPHDSDFRNAKIVSIEGVTESQPSSKKVIQLLTDHQEDDSASLKIQGEQTLVFHLDQPQKIDKIYLAKSASSSSKKNQTITFEAFVHGEWKFILYNTQAGLTSCMPYKTDKIRATFSKSQTSISELNFITNPKIKPLNKGTW